jgi:hypothetical protein
MELVQDCK